MDRLVRELGPWERTIRCAAYGLLVIAGVGIPPVVIGQVANPWSWAGVALWMAFGGLLAAIGTAAGRWPGEFIGLPFIATGLFSFGILQLAATHWSWLAVPGASILWAFALLAVSRWTVVRLLAKTLDVAHGGAHKRSLTVMLSRVAQVSWKELRR